MRGAGPVVAKRSRRRLKGPKVVVIPPGPASKSATALKEKYIADGLRVALPVKLVRGEGSFVEDADGNVYVDLTSGIGVQNLGHRPREVVDAAKAQLDALIHISSMVATYEPLLGLAKRMGEIAPRGLTKSIVLNSGSEAVENAAKIARAHTRRPWFVSFRTGFHGRTLLDLSLSGKPVYRNGFRPVVREVKHVEYAYCYRCPLKLEYPSCGFACVDEVRKTVTSERLAGKVAALFAEPVQGEGGFIVPPRDYFAQLRKLCDDEGIVFVDDEVQAGMGRTGRMWAVEHYGTTPDLLVSGKALGGGLPIGAVTGRPEIMDAAKPGTLGGTFGGNPVVCAAALESIESVQANLANAAKLGGLIGRRLREFQDEFEAIGDVRGLGAMWGMEFVRNRDSREPWPQVAREVQLQGLRRGLLLLTAGFHDNVVRLLPPINIDRDVMEDSLERLRDSIAAGTSAQAEA